MGNVKFYLLKHKVLLVLMCSFTVAGCGGSGTDEQVRIAQVKDGDGKVCMTVYDPVCGKVASDLVCTTQPCPTHRYRTFSNSCTADLAHARIAFDGECEALEDQVAFGAPPVQMTETRELPERVADVTIIDAGISGDLASLEVRYPGGCEAHQFSLMVGQEFRESVPPQASSVLIHKTNDTCEAMITDHLRFDLLPLREFYRRSYGAEQGEVQFEGIGVYQF